MRSGCQIETVGESATDWDPSSDAGLGVPRWGSFTIVFLSYLISIWKSFLKNFKDQYCYHNLLGKKCFLGKIKSHNPLWYVL